MKERSNEILAATHFTVHDFMRTELGLKGAELSVFALIYAFTRDGVNTFWGSQAYIANVTGYSTRTVRRALGRLTELGLLRKFQRFGTHYSVVGMDFFMGKNVRSDGKDVLPYEHGAGGQNVPRDRTKCPLAEDKMSDNNKDDNKEIINTSSPSSSKARTARERKKSNDSEEKDVGIVTRKPSALIKSAKEPEMPPERYDFVKLDPDGLVVMTREQADHIRSLVGEEMLHLYAVKIYGLIFENNKVPHSPYRTILKWIRADLSVEDEARALIEG